MTIRNINFIVFIVISLVFAIVGFISSVKNKSAKDYFRNPSFFRNSFSLIASNITLGTGLVYLISGAVQMGTLLLLAPWALFIGYLILGRMLNQLSDAKIPQGKNLLSTIADRIKDATGRPTPYALSISGILSVLMIILLAFEIFASAKVVAPLIFENPSLKSEVTLSSILFIITILYAILGGISAILNVDFLQIPLIILFVPVFLLVGLGNQNDSTNIAAVLRRNLRYDSITLFAIFGAIINAGAGQLYSLLNLGTASQVNIKSQKRFALFVGFVTAIILSCFILVGLNISTLSDANPWRVLMERFTEPSLGSIKGLLFNIIIIAGMSSILFTTTDAVVFNAVMFWYDNVARRNSFSEEKNKSELKMIRIIGIGVFSISFSVLCLLNYFQPDPFYFLLGLAGGVNVFSPMVLIGAFACSNQRIAKLLKPINIYGYIVLFVCVGIINMVLLKIKSPYVPHVSMAAFFVSSLYTLFIWLKARLSDLDSN